MIDVLVAGDANPDVLLRGDVVPRFGQAEQLLAGADLVLGGSAAITAHGLARLGRATRLAAQVGRDAFGDATLAQLSGQGVDVSAVFRHPTQPSGVTFVLSDGAERAILTFPGTIATLSLDHLLTSISTAARDGARHLHISSFFLLPTLMAGLPQVLKRARALGLATSLDTNYDPAEAWDGLDGCLADVDLLLPNRTEALALATRFTGRLVADVLEAGGILAQLGPTVVIKDGPDGAWQVDRAGTTLHAPGRPVTPVDTTGAGDTFNAAYLDSRLRQLPAAECLRRATAAGALSTSGVGGTAAQPHLEDLIPANEG